MGCIVLCLHCKFKRVVLTPLKESFLWPQDDTFKGVILTPFGPTPSKGHFDPLQGSILTLARVVWNDSSKSQKTNQLFKRVVLTLILGHFYSYFGSFLLLLWVISTLIMGHFYSYYGSFILLFWVIPTPIRHHFNPYSGNFKVSCKGKIASTWFMNMHTQESIEVLVNNLLSTCYDNTILNI